MQIFTTSKPGIEPVVLVRPSERSYCRSMTTFEKLLREAEETPIGGWDFTRLGDRISKKSRPWDFKKIVEDHARQAEDLLDMGTGGGERLAELAYRPNRTVSTEGWAPNVEIAGARLRPLGVTVVWVG